MYLELIYTVIKAKRWKIAEVKLSIQGLKQVGKIAQGLRPLRKIVYAGTEAGRISRAEI